MISIVIFHALNENWGKFSMQNNMWQIFMLHFMVMYHIDLVHKVTTHDYANTSNNFNYNYFYMTYFRPRSVCVCVCVCVWVGVCVMHP